MKKIGFIGAGNMAFAMLSCAVKALSQAEFTYTDINNDRLEYVKSETGLNYLDTNEAVVDWSDIVIIAVKPQYYDTVLSEVSNCEMKHKIFISIAPGITIDYVIGMLGKDARVVRAMPNTPAMVGEGMTGISYNALA